MKIQILTNFDRVKKTATLPNGHSRKTLATWIKEQGGCAYRIVRANGEAVENIVDVK